MSLFTEAHQSFRRRVRQFVNTRLTPNADRWEREAVFPPELFRELGKAGLLGLGHDRRYGGQELDFGFDIVLAEELARCKAAGLALSIVAQNHFFMPLLARHGSEQQRREFLAPAIRGEKVGALASTEPGGGTDIVNAIRCEARDHGDDWVICGEKKYITNGPIADFIVLLARTRPEPSTTSLTLIIVPTDTMGFRVRETLRTLGLHTSPTGWLEFDNCSVPKSLTLGRQNLGFFYATQVFLVERLIGSASALALASLALEDTITYLRNRVAFGEPLSQMQVIRHRVSEMAAEIEMARRFVYSVCESYKQGVVEAKEICMIKFQVPELVQDVIRRCLQLHGGYGFLEDNWLARAYRDARFLTVGGGATEAMKDMVASYLRL
jgi:citronellyl-CoA dehydrogenase